MQSEQESGPTQLLSALTTSVPSPNETDDKVKEVSIAKQIEHILLVSGTLYIDFLSWRCFLILMLLLEPKHYRYTA